MSTVAVAAYVLWFVLIWSVMNVPITFSLWNYDSVIWSYWESVLYGLYGLEQ